jgi:Domain of unknown function (DUF4266)
MIRISLALMCVALTSACSLQPVNPWQKGNLAKPIMALDPDPLETRFDQHTYFSKESASGGSGVGGGGCGCN